LAIKRRQHSVEQIVATLRQAELGIPVSEQVRQLGVSAQTFYCWKKQYAGLESSQVRELMQRGWFDDSPESLAASKCLSLPSCSRSYVDPISTDQNRWGKSRRIR
jgi:putative transposase